MAVVFGSRLSVEGFATITANFEIDAISTNGGINSEIKVESNK
jgi:hypothetical protein